MGEHGEQQTIGPVIETRSFIGSHVTRVNRRLSINDQPNSPKIQIEPADVFQTGPKDNLLKIKKPDEGEETTVSLINLLRRIEEKPDNLTVLERQIAKQLHQAISQLTLDLGAPTNLKEAALKLLDKAEKKELSQTTPEPTPPPAPTLNKAPANKFAPSEIPVPPPYKFEQIPPYPPEVNLAALSQPSPEQSFEAKRLGIDPETLAALQALPTARPDLPIFKENTPLEVASIQVGEHLGSGATASIYRAEVMVGQEQYPTAIRIPHRRRVGSDKDNAYGPAEGRILRYLNSQNKLVLEKLDIQWSPVPQAREISTPIELDLVGTVRKPMVDQIYELVEGQEIYRFWGSDPKYTHATRLSLQLATSILLNKTAGYGEHDTKTNCFSVSNQGGLTRLDYGVFTAIPELNSQIKEISEDALLIARGDKVKDAIKTSAITSMHVITELCIQNLPAHGLHKDEVSATEARRSLEGDYEAIKHLPLGLQLFAKDCLTNILSTNLGQPVNTPFKTAFGEDGVYLNIEAQTNYLGALSYLESATPEQAQKALRDLEARHPGLPWRLIAADYFQRRGLSQEAGEFLQQAGERETAVLQQVDQNITELFTKHLEQVAKNLEHKMTLGERARGEGEEISRPSTLEKAIKNALYLTNAIQYQKAAVSFKKYSELSAENSADQLRLWNEFRFITEVNQIASGIISVPGFEGFSPKTELLPTMFSLFGQFHFQQTDLQTLRMFDEMIGRIKAVGELPPKIQEHVDICRQAILEQAGQSLAEAKLNDSVKEAQEGWRKEVTADTAGCALAAIAALKNGNYKEAAVLAIHAEGIPLSSWAESNRRLITRLHDIALGGIIEKERPGGNPTEYRNVLAPFMLSIAQLEYLGIATEDLIGPFESEIIPHFDKNFYTRIMETHTDMTEKGEEIQISWKSGTEVKTKTVTWLDLENIHTTEPFWMDDHYIWLETRVNDLSAKNVRDALVKEWLPSLKSILVNPSLSY